MKKGGKKVDKENKKSGAWLAIAYGYVPCRLGLCGPEDKKRKDIIGRYLNGDNMLEKKVEEILKEFKGAYPYYRLIARCNKISNPLDYNVVEAYWLGNDLLKKVKVADLKKMMEEKFLPLGKMPAEKIVNLPKNAAAFHNFHVLSIGSMTGRFKETQAGLNLCRVNWGKVKKIKDGEIVATCRLLKFGKNISLGKTVDKTVKWNKDILPEVRIGDWVSIHWNHAIEKLSKEKLKNIKKFTRKIIVN